VWKMTNSYFGQPYIWCYLGNFGGNTMLVGNLQEVENRMENALVNGGKNLTGVGSTLEGLDVNPIMYDYVFEKVWSDGKVDVEKWVSDWSDRRLGRIDENNRKGWSILLDKVYTTPSKLGQGILVNAKPALKGTVHWSPNPKIVYDNKDLLAAWRHLLAAEGPRNATFNYDITNVGWQVLGNYFVKLRDAFTTAYEKKDMVAMQSRQAQMLELIDDIDRLLSTQSSMLLGKWLQDARAIGKDAKDKDYYEKDARMIITVWGGEKRSLNDYANRSWAGLTQDFYKKRWAMFLEEVIGSVQQGKSFDEKAFKQKIYDFEDKWVRQKNNYTAKPVGDSYAICKQLFDKYAGAIQNQ
jgi:alpha-N-acetylglucosaminidase